LTVVDGTVGGGGHSQKIAERIAPDGVLIGLDRDPLMLSFASEKIGGNRHLVQASYRDVNRVLKELKSGPVDRILLDLGLSSDQLADRERGFGFMTDAPLDMRFDVSAGESAVELLSKIEEEALAELLSEYGEERFSESIARRIVERRRLAPVRTTKDLVQVVEEAIPEKFRREATKDSATRVFQALRIAVNQELQHLQEALTTELPAALAAGGRLAVITFHSLEDRLVKNAFRDETRWQLMSGKPVLPTPAEVRMNPRSRSAKLRTAMKR
jgi:16S rRNA (cytosine1402-N4)-methyltransferase